MDGAIIALWVTTTATATGVVYSIVKNGRSRAKQDAELKVELKKDIEAIKKVLDDPNDGLSAIRREISAQREHCAGVTARFDQRISGLEKRDEQTSL